MAEPTRAFRVADIEVSLRGETPADVSGLPGSYDHYPSRGRRPDVVLDVSCVNGFTAPPTRSEYPGFDSRSDRPGSTTVWRNDASGTIMCPDDPGEPIRAGFRVATTAAVESAIRIVMSIALPRVGGLILHSSAVANGDRALIFTGRSGAGKSTISNLLHGEPGGLVKLADDLAVLRPGRSDRWLVQVSPFDRAQGLRHGHHARAASIHFISHARAHRRRRLSAAAALPLLLQQTLAYAADAATAQRTLDAAHRLIEDVPCFTLEFARDPSVAEVLALGGA